MATNRNPDTGFPYGYIRADAIFHELFDQLCYTHGKDVNYESALADHLAQKRRDFEEAKDAHNSHPDTEESDDTEFDEDYERDQFAEDYQCDEPIYEGEHEGVKYRTSWLGGAQHLWVFKSPVLTKCAECSSCVPGAGDLDNVGDYLAYGVPASWLDKTFMEDRLFDGDWKVEDIAGRFRYTKVDDVQISEGSWETYEEALEAGYEAILQHKVGLTLDEIKAAVDAGKTVHWKNTGYRVLKGVYEYMIVYYEENAIGLTHQDGVTMNGKPEDFFIG